MGLRTCATNNEAFRALVSSYTTNKLEHAQRMKANGPVIGVLGFDVPDEVFIAADMLPLRLFTGLNTGAEIANKYLELAFDPLTRSAFESLTSEPLSGLLDFLAISNSKDAFMRLYYYMREIRRTGEAITIPELTCIDWAYRDTEINREWNQDELKRFIKQIEDFFNITISKAALDEAYAICESDRNALRAMTKLRRCDKPHINGSEALILIGSSYYMDRRVHAELTRLVCMDAQAWPVVDGLRIFLIGSPQEDMHLYNMLEAAGCVVISEDHTWGDRAFEYNAKADAPEHAIVERTMMRFPSAARSLPSLRTAAVCEKAQQLHADAVISFSYAGDEAESWDAPSLGKALKERGIGFLALDKQAYPVPDLYPVFIDFISSVKAGIHNG